MMHSLYMIHDVWHEGLFIGTSGGVAVRYYWEVNWHDFHFCSYFFPIFSPSILFIIEQSNNFNVACMVVFAQSAQCCNQLTMPCYKWHISHSWQCKCDEIQKLFRGLLLNTSNFYFPCFLSLWLLMWPNQKSYWSLHTQSNIFYFDTLL